MKRTALHAVIAAMVAAACGSAGERTPSTVSPSPTVALATSSPSAAPSPVTYAPSSVLIVVNGVERPYGSAIAVDGVGGTKVSLTFPFAVDRSSVERWLPRTASLSWLDDRTVVLTFAETEPNLGFKIPQISSVDGLGRIDLLIVGIRYISSVTIGVYSVADATALPAPKPSATWRVAGGNGFVVSPDVTHVLFFPVSGLPDAGSLRVVELATRSSTDLKVPQDQGGYVTGSGWLPDGRIVLVGGALWSGQVDRPLTRVADLSNVDARIAVPSPRGTYVAIVGTEAVWLADLRDGSLRAVAGSSGGCGNGLAWSKDETLLAWIDCADLSVRITDVARNRIARSIDGAAIGLSGQPTGDLIVARDSGEHGQGARSLGIVYTFSGVEKMRFLGYAWSVSADGRYLLNIGSCCAGGPTSSLTDLRMPDAQPVGLPGIASWTADGRILVANYSRS